MNLTLSSTPEALRERFATLQSAKDVADLLEIDLQRLNYHLYISPTDSRYKTFNIPKKSGGTRNISTPVTALKIMQQKLNQVLKCVYVPKPAVQSFIPGKSIKSNAEKHSGRQYILNVDLKDFFPSINFGRVRGMFMAFPYRLSPAVATVLAQICCFNNELPQGAPTSPIVSNMICAKLDSQLQRLAKSQRCGYTRYADDLTFSPYASTSPESFPVALAEITALGQVEAGPQLNRIITDNGFEINPDKVRLRTSKQRQRVTGLTVNVRPNVDRRYVRQIRAMLRAWRDFGLEAAQEHWHDKKHRNPQKQPPTFRQVVKGKIEFLGMVKGKDDPIYRRFARELQRLRLHKLYEDLGQSEDPQNRGYTLEGLLRETFELGGIRVVEAFRRNAGAEQIDGGFVLGDWHYIVECRWRRELAGIAELDGLAGKIARSGRQTMGLFLSINGWSHNVPNVLKQNPDKCIILMNGDDLGAILAGWVDLPEFMRAKLERFNFKAEPYYGADAYLEDCRSML